MFLVYFPMVESHLKKFLTDCIGKDFGLWKPSMVMLEQVKTVNQSELGEYIGEITDPRLTRIIGNSIKKTLGL